MKSFPVTFAENFYRHLTDLFEPKWFTKHTQNPQHISRNRLTFNYGIQYIAIAKQKSSYYTLPPVPACTKEVRVTVRSCFVTYLRISEIFEFLKSLDSFPHFRVNFTCLYRTKGQP